MLTTDYAEAERVAQGLADQFRLKIAVYERDMEYYVATRSNGYFLNTLKWRHVRTLLPAEAVV